MAVGEGLFPLLLRLTMTKENNMSIPLNPKTVQLMNSHPVEARDLGDINIYNGQSREGESVHVKAPRSVKKSRPIDHLADALVALFFILLIFYILSY